MAPFPSAALWRSALVTLAALGIGDALATEVQFFDAEGALLTGVTVDVTVYDAQGQVASRSSLPPDPDGTYDIAAEGGQVVGLQAHDGERRVGAAGHFQIRIPDSESPLPITLQAGSSNDHCADARPVVVLPALVSGTTGGASGPDPEAGWCGHPHRGPGVWFTVNGTGSRLIATTCHPTASHVLSVYCQDCAAPPACVPSDSAPGVCGFPASYSWCSQANVPYLIYVERRFDYASHSFLLEVTDTGDLCSPSVNCSATALGGCCTCLAPPRDCLVVDEGFCTGWLGGEYQGDGSPCLVDGGEAEVYESAPSLPIPCVSPAGVRDTIVVPDSFWIADLNVGLEIRHTWIGDMNIVIKHLPTGIQQQIWSQQCGSTDNIRSTADDEGTTLSCSAISAGPMDEVFWPPGVAGQGPLGVFDELDANGPWELFINDTFAGSDCGILDRWRLTFRTGPSVCAAGAEGGGGPGDPCENCAPEADGKVTLCHLPPGNPANAQTIRVSPGALPAHCRAHGDSCGECGSAPRVHEAIETAAPPAAGPLDLAPPVPPAGGRTERSPPRR